MRVRLDKWYLDVQSGPDFAYWYVARLVLGRVRLVTVESHEHGEAGVRRRAWWGFERAAGPRSLGTRAAALRVGRRETTLRIDSPDGLLQGTWRSTTPPPARPFRPLFRNANGWCDWKVWTPRANVTLRRGGSETSGLGYVDLVRFELPFWRVPFRSLCWGRLVSEERWIVLFRLDTGSGTLACALEEGGVTFDVSVEVERSDGASLPAFRWRVGTQRLDVETRRVLARAPVLDDRRLAPVLPRRLVDRLTSGAREEKFWAVAELDGTSLSGPMEEVRWHGH